MRAEENTQHTDVVVVGAGVGGLRTTLELAPLRITLVTKTPFGVGGSSPFAQGGIAAAVDREDSPELHAEDTIAAGGGLNNPAIVRLMTRRAPGEIRQLEAMGTRFDRTPTGRLALGMEGGHQRRRIVHAGGDATGLEMVRSLSEAVLAQHGVQIVEQAFATELIVEEGRVVGVVVDLGDGQPPLRIQAQAVVLATGGAGQLFLHTTNPEELTGDGIAMAARAGADLVDLEFVQFHPTALATEADPLPLLTEALRGEGASIVDESDQRFLAALHPDAELAPRDFVARALFAHQQEGHRVFLDVRECLGESIAERFPTVYENCITAGIDPARELIPITPAAHYLMGGVAVDPHGRSTLPGLWACGEVSATGAHGANRLASNSLLEAIVFGSQTAKDIKACLVTPSSGWGLNGEGSEIQPTRIVGKWVDTSPEAARRRLRRLMWAHAGLVRNAEGLAEALAAIEEIEAEYGSSNGTLGNLTTVARHLLVAAAARRETCGSHVRSDSIGTDVDRSSPRYIPLHDKVESERLEVSAVASRG